MLCDSGLPPVIANPRKEITLRIGKRYMQPAAELHKVEARSGTVTLVARGSPTRRSARVLTTQREKGTAPQALVAIGEAERNAVVRAVLDRLA